MQGRIPPHNLDAEQSLLGAMILDQHAINEGMESLKSDDFYSEGHRIIFDAILEMSDQNRPVDIITLSDMLSSKGKLDAIGGIGYLTDLTDKGILTTNAKQYANIIEEKATLRQLIRTSTEILEQGYSQVEATELIELAEKSIFDITQKKSNEGFTPIGRILTRAFEDIGRLAANEGMVTGITTGLVDVDKKTSGMQRSDMILIAARPSMGKTAFALNLCKNAAMMGGASVAIFSLEMAKEQLVQRMLSAEALVSMGAIKTGQLSEEDWPHLISAVGRLSKSKIFIDDTPAIGVTELRAKCRRLKAEHGLDVIMIDYLQLMSGTKAESRQQEISTISRSLKSIAREMDCPVLALSQLSRAPEQRADHRPMLSDLRESGAIEQDADLAMFLYRDEYYFPDKEDNKNKAELIIGKQRNGETGTVELHWMGQFQLFRDLSTLEQ
ncbi:MULTISPECIES: replicative DNA helicase [unclassified Fusibacter]|uniref:replicative DNA helicase n=1 Tax=unclassified Fusibacter TaxID=2624464 RepID=UPI001013665B|nr:MULTISPECIES: replicative DNA helicase [unclassified Fusibacter]MCK8060882.1 replicative DNA helicase [Fusibacter sp. A2]NPE23178.1 replicative DNA helicase [Fusibacter sp. A1]RXV59536.1 replicative DNA helicase [Fusibacter sp. A1]